LLFAKTNTSSAHGRLAQVPVAQCPLGNRFFAVAPNRVVEIGAQIEF